jgi:hypothetical protein
MAESEKGPAAKSAGKKAPKGGRKGGTTFPRINLERALKYADKLVSKTHTGALPESQILAGVFGSSGPDGQVRASALKQYGLLEGDKTAYKATPLAQTIDAALAEEKSAHIQKALLSSKLFQDIFETFQDDTVSRAKIRQRAQALKVHPDSAEECAGIFIDSAVTAGLGTVNGDSITLAKTASIEAPEAPADANDGEEHDEGEEEPEIREEGDEGPASLVAAAKIASVQKQGQLSTPNKNVVNVNLTVDSSSDPDKLEKQLKLLKRYGLV